MNTHRTDHEALEIDNRERYRQMLIDSQMPKAPHHYDIHDAPATLWECIALTAFAFGMLAILGFAISWGLR